MKLQRTVVLVGLMGAGKTSVGRRLADRLGVDFVDSDDEVVAAAHMTIPEIFESFGEPEFRRLERAVISRLLTGPAVVLSTGGGAFMQPEIRDLIQARATSVWLSAELSVLWSRVADKPGRPLLDEADPHARLSQLARDRNPVYAQADLTVRSDGKGSQDDVASAIERALRDRDAQGRHPPIFESIPS